MAEREVNLVLDAKARVAEGPTWDTRDNTLIWVDIDSHAVHKYDPATGQDRAWDVGCHVGAAVMRAAGGLALALRGGFATLDTDTGQVERIADVERDRPMSRMNDGKVDPAGRFWAGTLEDFWKDHAGVAALYRLDGDHSVHQMVTGVTLSNGLGWSPDTRTMYYVDTASGRLDAFDYDTASGAITNRRTLVEIPQSEGFPDGLAVDAQGYIWLAVYNAWSVRRYAPDGSLDEVIRLPVSQVTCPGFGGPDLRDLYITSATEEFTAEQWQREPHGGGLFRVRLDVPGLAPAAYVG